MIKTEATDVTGPMNKAEAQAITERIRNGVEDIRKLVVKAREGKAWKALGYGTWEAYVKEEFGMSRSYAHRLEKQGEVIEAIENAVGVSLPMGNISERAARDIKGELPAVTAEIKQRVEAGEEPKKAVAETVAAAREAKQERKAELSPKPAPAAKPAPVDVDTLLAEVEELREANASMAAEIEALKAENKKFADLKLEYDRGGFDAILANKDQVIAVQKTRIERESQEKVRNLNTSEMWRKRAEEAGWSNDVVIPIPGRAAHA